MRILFIDDEPIRADILAKRHDVRIAVGIDQVGFYMRHLNSWRPDVVFLDHDMQQHANGRDVAAMFFIDRNIPIIIHSSNPDGASAIARLLEEYAVPHSIVPVTLVDWHEKVLARDFE